MTNGDDSKTGLLSDLLRNGKLAWQLLKDPRVATSLKLIIPGLTVAYLLIPIDLVPDVIPVLGQLDDIAVIALAIKLFIQFAPQDIVAEYRAGRTQPPAGKHKSGQDVVDGEYRVVD
jgi:uncharacterized membrane protein YkvA (DUF1232 family)